MSKQRESEHQSSLSFGNWKAIQQIIFWTLNPIQEMKTRNEELQEIRHQVCAHRWQAKTPQAVLAEVQLCINTMSEIISLARFLILELAGANDSERKAELEKQQLSESTLSCIADDAEKVLRAFRLSEAHVPDP